MWVIHLEFTNPNWNNVYISIKENTLTYTEATFIIKNKNFISVDYLIDDYHIYKKNGDIWRDKYMQLAFYNQFNSGLPEAILEDKEYFSKWMQLRKYNYYQQHKEAVDKYGNITPEMQLSDEDVVGLKIYLGQKQDEIKAYIQRHGTNQLTYKYIF